DSYDGASAALTPLPQPIVRAGRRRWSDDASWARLLLAIPRHNDDAAARLFDVALFAVGMAGVVLMVAELELAYDVLAHSRASTMFTELMRMAIFADTVL